MLKNRRTIQFSFLFSLLIVILFGSIMYHGYKLGDFPMHIGWAKEFSQDGYLPAFPHSLFARLVSVTRALIPADILIGISPWVKHVWDLKSFDLSALIVVIVSYLATAWLILLRLVKKVRENDWTKGTSWLMGVATLSLLLVGPISFFTMWDRMYLGYFTGNPYHNPTYLLLRPFALGLYFIVSDNFFAKRSWKISLIASLLLIFATLSKPSLTLTFLPTIGIIILFHLREWKKINWSFLILSIGLIGAIILAWQYWVTYLGQAGDSIIIAPFKAILIFVPNIPTALFFALMSILFPLSVALFYWKEVKGQISFQIAWINLLIGLGMAFILAEAIRTSHLNFWWGPMIGLFLVFYCSLEFWLKKITDGSSKKIRLQKKDIAILSIFILHLVCGILYFVKVFINIDPNVVR